MTTCETDDRSPERRARDERIAAEPPMPPAELPPDTPFSSVEPHLARHGQRPMDAEALRQLDRTELADYLWRRLRLESPVDPPISERFGQEPPEQFVIQTVKKADDRGFHANVIAAVRDNLRRLAVMASASPEPVWDDPVTDPQLASLAFLASGIKGTELVGDLYTFAGCWTLGDMSGGRAFSAGQFHVLRTLAFLQAGGGLDKFWESLWQNGPRSARGLTLFGWARANAEDALGHLGELVDMSDEIDVPTAVWSLVTPSGPGINAVGRAAGAMDEQHRQMIRAALENSGADASYLRDFDLAAGPPRQDAWGSDQTIPPGAADGMDPPPPPTSIP